MVYRAALPQTAHHRLGIATALQLVGTIFDAPGDQGGWEAFVQRFGDMLRGLAPGLYLHDGDVPVLRATAAMDPAWGRAYDDYFVHRDVRRPRIRALPLRTVYVGQELVPDRELRRSEFYNDFLRPQGMFHALGAVVLKDDHRVGVLRVLRPEARPFGTDERRFLELLLPHVARALEIDGRLSAVRAERDARADVLDRFEDGVILLDREGRVLAANRYAESLLSGADGLVCVQGTLLASSGRDDVFLRRLIAGAGSRDPRRPEAAGGALVVRRPSGRAAYHLLIVPLAGSWLATAPRHAAVVVFVNDPARGVDADLVSLCRFLGLTRAEGRVVLALSRGLSTGDVARERDVSINTIRTHVKRSLAKAGVRRQADLVRLVLTGPSRIGTSRG